MKINARGSERRQRIRRNMKLKGQFPGNSLPDMSFDGSHLYWGVEYMSALAGPFSNGSVGWMV